MSWQAVRWVFEHEAITDPLDLAVALAIAEMADATGDSAWPSVTTITARSRCSRRTVLRAIARLEGAGVLRVDRGAQKRRGNSYRLPVPAAPAPVSRHTPDAPAGGEGWYAECARLHQGDCNGQYQHALRMDMARLRRTRTAGAQRRACG